ncbi:hypothetical protein LTR62_003198 [Meristemomyces frigidus]|uniref:Dynactin subunit 6 n=1 Tax=Meristemomyces frigidus TaxID=1508187 RepID=A0AAN7TJH1_9PEZI|nr:hypothetical protein LTR62_003198 [Meristemomyces frigidus]
MATTSSAKRKTDIPAAKPPCAIHSSAIIADKAQITGTHPVTIGQNTVLHPYARIRAEGGAVTIGRNCVVCEGAIVGTASENGFDVVIEDYVTIETGAAVEAKTVGYGCEIGVKAVVGREAMIGQWCRIAALEKVDNVVEDFTVVFGDGARREDVALREHEAIRDARAEGMEKGAALMRKLIPSAAAKWAG